MPNATHQLVKEGFRDAVRRTKRPAEGASLDHGPNEGKRPDRSLFLLAIDRIRPDRDQVRRINKSAKDPEVKELAQSIQAIGIENPLTVRYLRTEDIYELVSGERRYTAAKIVGLTEVPVKVVDVDEKTVRTLQLHENIHRAGLAPLELAAALQQLTDEGETADAITRMLCKSNTYVQKALTVARKLTAAAKKLVEREPGAYKSLDMLYEVALYPSEEQVAILQRMKDEKLTRSQMRQITAEPKRDAKARVGSTRGRKPQSKAFRQTIPVANGATITVTFRKTKVDQKEVMNALLQAVKSLKAHSRPHRE
jgi:ParB family chromosome partitioning protein